MLKLNLQPIFTARGIDRPYAFLVKAGFTPHSASVMINYPKAIKTHYIELLCIKLNCEPSDLFTWTPDKNNLLAENHPLRNLGGNDASVNGTLLDLPYKQLKELNLKISSQQKETGE